MTLPPEYQHCMEVDSGAAVLKFTAKKTPEQEPRKLIQLVELGITHHLGAQDEAWVDSIDDYILC
jgi:hypothetical protein